MSRALAQLEENLAILAAEGRISAAEKRSLDAEMSVESLVMLAARLQLEPGQLLQRSLRPQAPLKGIKMLVMDCDGVLTDGKMIVSEDGKAVKHFNVKDGLGIKRLQAAGFFTGIISAGHSTGVVEARAAQLDIAKVYVGRRPKWEVLSEWLEEYHISASEVAYIGDDLNDQPVLEKVGAAFCPADAIAKLDQVPQIQRLQSRGGEGCVRELIDRFLLEE